MSESNPLQSESIPAAGQVSAGEVLVGLLRSLRPHQWTKNGFIFFAPLFAQQLHRPEIVLRAIAAFVLFCALSGVVYLINDVADLPRDRAHPEKRHRPIASGKVPPIAAVLFAAALGSGALAGSFLLSKWFGFTAAAYLVNNLFYSFYLKEHAIVDVLSVATGFLLRAVAGGAATSVPISHWLVLCASLLALFLSFCKRRQELALLAGKAATHRASLRHYTPQFLDHMITVVAAATLIAYSLYAFAPETSEKLGTSYFGLTIPFVLYGIFRYLYLVHLKGEGGNPSRVLLRDRPLQLNLLLWGLTVLVLLYVRP